MDGVCNMHWRNSPLNFIFRFHVRVYYLILKHVKVLPAVLLRLLNYEVLPRTNSYCNPSHIV
jgi:hypothetical protein